MKLRNHKIDQGSCTNCKRSLNAVASATADVEPVPNDITICFYCGHIMTYDDSLKLRDLTPDEVVEVAGHPDIIDNQKAIKLRKALGSKNF
jgi:hypothetical protein